MGRKKTVRSAPKSHRRDRRTRERTVTDNNLGKDILVSIYRENKPLSINDMLKSLKLPPSARTVIETSVAALCRQGDIRKNGKNAFSLDSNLLLVEATIEKNPRGFGFATDVILPENRKIFKRDPFIAAARMASAHHGDRALIRVINVRRDGRPEAEVMHIISRGKTRLAGFYQSDRNHGIVHPEDPRYPFSIAVSQPLQTAVNDGDAVIVKLLEHRDAHARQSGEIVKVLGNPASAAVQAELVIEKFELTAVFSPEAVQESLNTLPTPGFKDREDLRGLLHITIDGADAKDFDDAVCVQKKHNGFRLWVSIADVGAYVKPGSRLDIEAYERGTSVYFPGKVVPMLPDNLSGNLCSLLPEKDRLAVTAVLDFDRMGNLKNKRFSRSIIKSHKRFTYDTVKDIIIGNDPAARRSHKAFLTPLKWASELARALRARRMERGSINFSIPEADIHLNSDGTIKAIARGKTHFIHQMIEEFMLAANEAVAQTFVSSHDKTLFRIHEKPDPEKVSDFLRFAETLGFKATRPDQNQSWYNEMIDQAAGTAHEYIINTLLLRTMQQARYSVDNTGHFGLAADNYLHFTSPIRRYPDLVVHRQLCGLIDRIQPDSQKKEPQSAPVPLRAAGLSLSAKERTAIDAERDMVERLKIQFISTQIGKTFMAVISGVSESSLYIELIDVFVNGVINLSTMTDDYYLYDEKRHRVVGDISGKTFQIGRQLVVELLAVDKRRNEIFFKHLDTKPSATL
jgi:ribonuclease R